MFTEDRAPLRLQPSPVLLRPYQQQALAELLACRDEGIKRLLVVMPTGTGKTTLFSALIGAHHEVDARQSLVLAHRRELLDQAFRRIALQNSLLDVAIEAADRKLRGNADVVVGSVQSLGRPESSRLATFNPSLVIIDEAHHAAAATYQRAMERFGCFGEDTFTVGVTATPHRMDNRQLHGDDQAIFQEVAFTYGLRDAIQEGWLADIRGYRVATGIDLSGVRVRHGDYNAGQLQNAVNTAERNEAAFHHWSEVAFDRRTIVFCSGIQHAADVAELFRSKGIACESVNGTTPTLEREAILRRFSTGRTQVLANVDIATEGFDLPDVACVLMLRPTQSWALYTQMVGRGLRVLPNTIDGIADAAARRTSVRASEKPDCIVIDIVDNGDRVVVPKEPGAEKPSIASIVGLPADFDLQGHSLSEAIDSWDALTPAGRAVLFRRPTKYEDLGATLTAVDILAELSMPESVAQSSRNAWMKVGDGSYMLACGSGASDGERTARIECDPIGRFTLYLTVDGRPMIDSIELGTDLALAFRIGDRKVKELWPFSGGFTSSRGRWRSEPATKRQLSELRGSNIDPAMVALVETAGQAWNLIELHRRTSPNQ
jgi:ATP-dependent helicase IRC3